MPLVDKNAVPNPCYLCTRIGSKLDWWINYEHWPKGEH